MEFLEISSKNQKENLHKTSIVTALSFESDNRFLVSGHYNGIINIWDIKNKKQLIQLFHQKKAIRSIKFSKKGKYIKIYTHNSNNYIIFDLVSGKKVANHILSGNQYFDSIQIFSTFRYLRIGGKLYSFPGEIVTWHLLPDKKEIFISYFDKNLVLYDLNNQKEILFFKGHIRKITSLDVSPDEKYMVSGSWDGTIRVWEIKTGKEFYRFYADFPVNAVSYSLDGKYIAFGGFSDSIIITDHKLKSILYVLK